MKLFADFFTMGGYGLYVWLAYGVVTVVLVGYLCVSLHKFRKTKRAIYRWLNLHKAE